MSERELRGLHLHLDCASGAAGDMFLGALLDLGVPVEVIGQALDAIGAGRQRLQIARVMKRGIASVDVKVDTSGHVLDEHRHEHGRAPHTHGPAGHGPAGHGPAGHGPAGHLPHSVLPKSKRATTQSGHSGSFVAIKFREESHERHVHVDELGGKVEEVLDHAVPPHAHPHPHPHDHARGPSNGGQGHGDHAHYHYAAIRERLVRAPLGDGVRTRALDIFDRLARAEAKLHGTTVDQVTFHEVGAIDSIVDVVGTAAAIDWLWPESVSCASVAMGHGTLSCAHGVLPVPAPAALEVLREAGGITADGGVATELCTPTGAAILASIVTSWTAAPTGRPVAVGWGAGDSDLADRANVLRIVAMEPVTLSSDTVWQVDANIDDMSPELAGAASEALFAAGALDVWWTPITMKKGRPAVTLSVLAEATTRDAVIAAMLRETTTIGVRYAELSRTVLTRSIVEVDTRYGRIPVKIASDGQAVRNVAPEYEACAAAARSHGVPVKLVLAAALAAYDSRR